MSNTPYTGGDINNVQNSAYQVLFDGVDSGLAHVTSSLQATLETQDVQFLQDATPRTKSVTSQTLTFDLVLNELTNINLKRYFGELATIDSGYLYYGEAKGQTLPEVEVTLLPLAVDGNPWAGKTFTFHKCNLVPNGPIPLDPSTDDFESLPIQVTALKDNTQTAGREFLTFGPTVTAVPAWSSTVPANAAVAVAVDDDIVITFLNEMGIGPWGQDAIAGTVLVAETTVTTPPNFDDVVAVTASFDSTKKIITLSHAVDFNAASEYQIIITTKAVSASGVPIAEPLVTTFTTA